MINFPNLEEGDLTKVEIKIVKKAFNYSNSLDILPLSLFPILNLGINIINIKIANDINYKISGIFDKEFSITNKEKFINLKFLKLKKRI